MVNQAHVPDSAAQASDVTAAIASTGEHATRALPFVTPVDGSTTGEFKAPFNEEIALRVTDMVMGVAYESLNLGDYHLGTVTTYTEARQAIINLMANHLAAGLTTTESNEKVIWEPFAALRELDRRILHVEGMRNALLELLRSTSDVNAAINTIMELLCKTMGSVDIKIRDRELLKLRYGIGAVLLGFEVVAARPHNGGFAPQVQPNSYAALALADGATVAVAAQETAYRPQAPHGVDEAPVLSGARIKAAWRRFTTGSPDAR